MTHRKRHQTQINPLKKAPNTKKPTRKGIRHKHTHQKEQRPTEKALDMNRPTAKSTRYKKTHRREQRPTRKSTGHKRTHRKEQRPTGKTITYRKEQRPTRKTTTHWKDNNPPERQQLTGKGTKYKQDIVERSCLLYILWLAVINSLYILASWVLAKTRPKGVMGDGTPEPTG